MRTCVYESYVCVVHPCVCVCVCVRVHFVRAPLLCICVCFVCARALCVLFVLYVLLSVFRVLFSMGLYTLGVRFVVCAFLSAWDYIHA